MKRLVYTPRIDVYIKADTGVYNVSPYVTAATVDRKVNQVSTATVTLRNPGFMFTENKYRDPVTKEHVIGPLFHPMDPIIILMTRLRDRPIQVFTGFCDTTPYLQLFPGTCSIQASCTLKRLVYTYWDPGLPFMQDWLSARGWAEQSALGGGGIFSPKQAQNKSDKTRNVDDAGIGRLLFDVLHDIGNWPKHHIYIEKLPGTIFSLIAALYDQEKQVSEDAQKEFENLLHQIIGSDSLGGGGGSSSSGDGGGPSQGDAVSAIDVGRAMLTAGFPRDKVTLARGMAVVKVESDFGRFAGWDRPNSADCIGYWQIQLSSHPQYSSSCLTTLVCSTKAAHDLWTGAGHSFARDWYNFEGSGSAVAQNYSPYLDDAEHALGLGPFNTSAPLPSGVRGPSGNNLTDPHGVAGLSL